jgi:hypothetical protein
MLCFDLITALTSIVLPYYYCCSYNPHRHHNTLATPATAATAGTSSPSRSARTNGRPDIQQPGRRESEEGTAGGARDDTASVGSLTRRSEESTYVRVLVMLDPLLARPDVAGTGSGSSSDAQVLLSVYCLHTILFAHCLLLTVHVCSCSAPLPHVLYTDLLLCSASVALASVCLCDMGSCKV